MPDSPRQTHRSFTVRVPMATYVQIADLAQESNTNMNVKVNELLTLGLGKNIQIEEVLARLLRRVTTEDLTNEND
jgi:hypothetical protein